MALHAASENENVNMSQWVQPQDRHLSPKIEMDSYPYPDPYFNAGHAEWPSFYPPNQAGLLPFGFSQPINTFSQLPVDYSTHTDDQNAWVGGHYYPNWQQMPSANLEPLPETNPPPFEPAVHHPHHCQQINEQELAQLCTRVANIEDYMKNLSKWFSEFLQKIEALLEQAVESQDAKASEN